ncbi:alpha/beta-hydrolase [Tothia fuscella]|uniref:Alpha/beta-hydrolase n=1 Tax=Tothia fuscella TaxID=1048955 RepID=A0A9P4U1Q1_9PEZI|nr:alpha/beta-hydrolase [Tothia fuscella]
MAENRSKKSAKYPEPLIVLPIKEHKQSFIILHGRGSSAQKFSEPFLSHAITPLQSEGTTTSAAESPTFQSSFPHAKFVFPNAALRRAVIYHRSLTHQWFDNWSLDRPEYRQELQNEGLRESSKFVHSLLQKEIDIVGAPNVILIGLSQGCATSLISLLTWEGQPIAGMLGMCGWLPLREMMAQNISDPGEEDNPFGVEEDGMSENPKLAKLGETAVFLKQELELEEDDDHGSSPFSIPLQHIPVFLGHGDEDVKVPCELGRKASKFLQDLEIRVEWNEYKKLGHWYSADMLRDMVRFIHTIPGWEEDS